MSEPACTHPEIVPCGGDWARCTTCGDDTFPLVDPFAGIAEFAPGPSLTGAEVTEVLAAVRTGQEHQWTTMPGFDHEFCRKCTIVRRADDKNKPCRGSVRLSLRSNEHLGPDPADVTARTAGLTRSDA
jgi:hypothetical protein